MIFNKQLCTELAIAEPATGMSWEALITWAEQAYPKSGNKIYGTMDPSADYKALWMWLRQQSKELYSGKTIGASKDDIAAWFTLWQGARDRKAAPTADIIHEANGGDVTKQLVVTGKAATSFLWGLLPLFAWELFSLIYYGTLVPNTALAKIAPGVSLSQLVPQGLRYFSATFS